MGWLRRLRGALGMGITWAVAWALFGILIGVASILTPWLPWEAFFEVFDAPLPALAVPGFVGGTLFSGVLGIAARNRRFDELSVGRMAALGAAGGLLLAVFPEAMVLLGLATLAPGVSFGSLAAVVALPAMILGSISAAGSLKIAQLSEDRMLTPGDEIESVGLTDVEARELLGEG